jgi:uncharacterized protein YkwD
MSQGADKVHTYFHGPPTRKQTEKMMGLVLVVLCASCVLASWEQDVVNRHNELRRTKGLKPLVWDATLAQQAQRE